MNFDYTTLCFFIQTYIPIHPQYTLFHYITQSHVCINTHRHTVKHRYSNIGDYTFFEHTVDDASSSLLWVSSLFLDGPVTVGMSLDIASIDTISEINMVRQYFYTLLITVIQQQTQNYISNEV